MLYYFCAGSTILKISKNYVYFLLIYISLADLTN